MGLNRIHFLRSICRWPIVISLRCLLVKSLREDSVQHLPNFGHLGCLGILLLELQAQISKRRSILA